MTKRYAMGIDLERCIGCHTCTIACKVENNWEKGSGIRVETVGGPYQDTPSGTFPTLNMHYLPVPCMHCKQPPCLDACPVEAISKRHDGIVLIDTEKCNGCQACLSVCPYGALHEDAQTGTVRKCTFCAHRLDKGLEPFCVRCCEGEALYFGDLNDPSSEVAQLIAQRSVSPHMPEQETKSSVYYFTNSVTNTP